MYSEGAHSRVTLTINLAVFGDRVYLFIIQAAIPIIWNKKNSTRALLCVGLNFFNEMKSEKSKSSNIEVNVTISAKSNVIN